MHGDRELNAPGGERAGPGRTRERVWLALILLAALLLRTVRIEDFYIGPDDGAYLHSAQVDVIEPGGFHPVRWVQEDVAWVRWFAANYSDDKITYPHCYLHQFAARWFFRFSGRSLTALRLSSAITGALTVLFAWFFVTRAWPGRRRTALFAAAVLAVLPIHVFFSRTGWGQVGFACFYLGWLSVLHRVLFEIDDDDRAGFRRAGFGLMLLSLLSFGWGEGVAPYILGSGVVVAAAGLAHRGIGGLLTRRTWTYAWSSVPVGALTLALALYSPFAQRLWFAKEAPRGMSWLDLKSQTLGFLFRTSRLDLLVTWPLLLCAAAGVVVALRRCRQTAWFLLGNALGGTAILFLFFADAWLVRAHMPLFVALAIFAAIGLDALVARLRGVGAALGGLILASLLWITGTTLWGRVGDLAFLQRLYNPGAPPEQDFRDVDRPILDHLIAHRSPDDTYGVFGDKSAIFRLQDAGLRGATENYMEGPNPVRPRWVVAARNTDFAKSPHTIERGGPYRFVVRDTIDRWSLYERVP